MGSGESEMLKEGIGGTDMPRFSVIEGEDFALRICGDKNSGVSEIS